MKTIDLTLIIGVILVIVVGALLFVIWKTRKWPYRFWVLLFFLIYIVFVIKITWFPLVIYSPEVVLHIKEGIGNNLQYYNLQPFKSISNYIITGAYIQIYGNIILLMPMVFFINFFVFSKIKWPKLLMIGLSLSVLIEVIQLFENLITQIPGRIADIDDVILNIVGVCISILIFNLLIKKTKIFEEDNIIFYRKRNSQKR